MTSQYERFKETLKQMLMLDQADLDFGIYRIMNRKRSEIEQYLNTELKKQVAEAVSSSCSSEVESLKNELAKAIQNAHDLGVDPENLPKVMELQAKLSEAGEPESIENEVYSHLTTFFSRYYDSGDYITQRRYKKDVYTIPYEGEEIKLHWANADQYYIKTSEYFRSYRFKLSGNKDEADNERSRDPDVKYVEFSLKRATVEQNNNIAQNNMERRFALYEELPLCVEDNTLHINFTYELHPKAHKQKELVQQAYDAIKGAIPAEFAEVMAPRPTEKDEGRTLLRKHLNDYVARNTFDYFIHKDLYGFLSRELDFYIKNEILVIDDIDDKNPGDVVLHLSVVKAIQSVGKEIIRFLASLEEFQKKLWMKKKFVVQTDYCITLDRVPNKLYAAICGNDKQREEWVKLFAIDEINADANHHAYSVPLTQDFLKENPFLVLDTAFFADEFKHDLLSEIDNIDKQCDGLIINSENFQAINLLKEKYKNQIKCIYIDPPYNAKSSEILYKNSFKHSTWLSLMENRLSISNELLKRRGVEVIAIDEIEQLHLGELLKMQNPDKEVVAVSIIHNPSGQQGYNISFSHEFAYFVYPNFSKQNTLGLEKRSESDWDTRTFRDNSGNSNLRTDAANCFYPIYVESNKIVGFGDVCEDSYHPESRNIIIDDKRIAVYPIDNNGIEKKWVFERGTVEGIIDELWVKNIDQNEIDIMRTKKEFRFKSCWIDTKYSANSYGSKLLTAMKIPFDYPKSIHNVTDCVTAALAEEKDGIAFDFFAGSGTTGHAVLNLNRLDGHHRKYILCEMGEYMYTATKPRMQKAIYSYDWNEGKPISRKGCSHCFKYLRLEQYEDTLNNLVTESIMIPAAGEFYKSYVLDKLLGAVTNNSLFNLQWFRNPWEAKLLITHHNETKEENIDLIETFNYLIGLNVESICYPKKGICTVEGMTRAGERTLIIWRNVDMIDNDALNRFFKKQAYSTRDSEFDRIYVNGDNNLENLRAEEDRQKVVLTEKEFAKRMFEEC